MSLNIKNEHVHDLVRQAAERTGLSQTGVVERALDELLRHLDAEDDVRRRRVDEILTSMRARLSEEDKAALSTDFRSDDDGLPA